jgi:hypothetical protein
LHCCLVFSLIFYFPFCRALGKKDEEIGQLKQALGDTQAMFALEREKSQNLKQQLEDAKILEGELQGKLENQRKANAELKSELESSRSALDDAHLDTDTTRAKLNDDIAHLKSLLALEKKSSKHAVDDANRQLELVKARLAKQTQRMSAILPLLPCGITKSLYLCFLIL